MAENLREADLQLSRPACAVAQSLGRTHCHPISMDTVKWCSTPAAHTKPKGAHLGLQVSQAECGRHTNDLQDLFGNVGEGYCR
jgi:hypothetical protein